MWMWRFAASIAVRLAYGPPSAKMVVRGRQGRRVDQRSALPRLSGEEARAARGGSCGIG